MQFCPKCKSIMLPEQGLIKCRACGFVTEREAPAKNRVHQILRQKREILVLDEELNEGKPTIKARCPECNCDMAYWWLRQLRAADESEVRFFRCVKCGKTWREYD